MKGQTGRRAASQLSENKAKKPAEIHNKAQLLTNKRY
jgi:hypothetical protein